MIELLHKRRESCWQERAAGRESCCQQLSEKKRSKRSGRYAPTKLPEVEHPSVHGPHSIGRASPLREVVICVSHCIYEAAVPLVVSTRMLLKLLAGECRRDPEGAKAKRRLQQRQMAMAMEAVFESEKVIRRRTAARARSARSSTSSPIARNLMQRSTCSTSQRLTRI
jgi:hypothetical protein